MALVVMGVSGSGKTGLAATEMMGLPFFDGDDLHSDGRHSKSLCS